MQNSNKIFYGIGIPYAALLSVVFVLFVSSIPVGIYVVFESEIGGDINHQYPLSHLDIFANTDFYQTPVDINIGDAFVVLWVFYLVLFVIAFLGPDKGFFKSISSIVSCRILDSENNYMTHVIKWFSIIVLVSVVINFIQELFGITTVPPLKDNSLIQFFQITLAPVIEEFGFRIILVGIPLFALYSSKPSIKYFIKCLWNPKNLNIHNTTKAILLIVFVGILFGFAHIAFGESWSEGKFAQASVGGIILGWVYLRYGFITSLLIHWATNYFIFSFANFITQLNDISIESAFSHSLMSSIEIILLASGIFSTLLLVLPRIIKK